MFPNNVSLVVVPTAAETGIVNLSHRILYDFTPSSPEEGVIWASFRVGGGEAEGYIGPYVE